MLNAASPIIANEINRFMYILRGKIKAKVLRFSDFGLETSLKSQQNQVILPR